jgi:hypothetical protein
LSLNLFMVVVDEQTRNSDSLTKLTIHGNIQPSCDPKHRSGCIRPKEIGKLPKLESEKKKQRGV